MFSILLLGAIGAALAIAYTTWAVAHAIPRANDDLIFF